MKTINFTFRVHNICRMKQIGIIYGSPYQTNPGRDGIVTEQTLLHLVGHCNLTGATFILFQLFYLI